VPITAAQIRRRFANCGVTAKNYGEAAGSLSEFLAICSDLLGADETYWFRGLADKRHQLVPSALRYPDKDRRTTAISGVKDVTRILSYKLQRPPAPGDRLKWLQIAQHYGYPTRLLDWTQNPVVALFFACCGQEASDGLVAVLRPVELNTRLDPTNPRIFEYEADKSLIDSYLDLDGRIDSKRGKRTIAISPSWDHERIFVQQGFFTLHGSRAFALDDAQASSLIYIPVLKESKARLVKELSRVGMGEMFVYPEPEHTCSHLKRQKGLL